MLIKELKIIIDNLSEEQLKNEVVVVSDTDTYNVQGAEYDEDTLIIEL